MASPTTIGQLVRRMKNGDVPAARELIEQHGGVVESYVRRHCGPESSDAYQEIMLQAWLYLSGFDLRLMSWGDGAGVPTSGTNLVILGTDNAGLLHIRIFNASGALITDTDETKLPTTQAGAISTLKQRLPSLLPPHALTSAETTQLNSDVTSIIGQTHLSNAGNLRLQTAEEFAAWLTKIAQHEVVSMHRRQAAKVRDIKRNEGDDAFKVIAASDTTASQTARGNELKLRLESLMTPSEAEIVGMRVEGYIIKEIAEKTGRSQGAITQKLHRLRRKLNQNSCLFDYPIYGRK